MGYVFWRVAGSYYPRYALRLVTHRREMLEQVTLGRPLYDQDIFPLNDLIELFLRLTRGAHKKSQCEIGTFDRFCLLPAIYLKTEVFAQVVGGIWPIVNHVELSKNLQHERMSFLGRQETERPSWGLVQDDHQSQLSKYQLPRSLQLKSILCYIDLEWAFKVHLIFIHLIFLKYLSIR